MAAGFIGALDIGTSSVRALLFDERARQVKGVEVHLPYTPRVAADGTYETDAGRLFQVVATAVDGLLHEAGPRRRRQIRAIGVSTFWHGLVGATSDGRPLTPLYLWADTRAWREADELRQQLDGEAIHQRTGCLLHPSYWPAKLLWLRRRSPELFARRDLHWLSFWDLVQLRLFGQPLTSISMASGTGLLKLRDCDWDGDLLERLQVSRDQLSPLGEAGHGLTQRWAMRWPELKEVPWVCAAGDGALANLGSGCTSTAERALTVGTSAALRVLFAGLPERIPDGLWCYRLDRRRAVLGGSFSNGGNLYAWLTRTLALGERASLERRLRKMAAGEGGLTFLPLLAGERSPGWASHATGAVAGLTQATTSEQIAHAGLEAVAIEFAGVDALLDAVLPGAQRLIANGAGLLASPAWMQICADALGKPVAASKAGEASSRGAAILALEQVGLLDGDRLEAEVGRTYEPDVTAQATYASLAERQRQLYRFLIAERGLDTVNPSTAGVSNGGAR